ncbi:MAG: hypothetical protein AB7D27_13785 [Desulfomicrobium sp.]
MEAAVQITNGQKPLTDVEKELLDIHQGYFRIMAMLRMIRQSADADSFESQAASDIVEVLDQFIPTVDALRIRLDAAICKLK